MTHRSCPTGPSERGRPGRARHRSRRLARREPVRAPGHAPERHRDLRPGRTGQARQRRLAALRHRQFAFPRRRRVGWAGARLNESADRRLSHEERRLAYAKDALVGLVAATGLATAAEGMRFARMAPGGAVPLRDGDHAAPSADEAARRSKRRVNLLSTANLPARSRSSPSTPPWRKRGSAARPPGASSRAGAASSPAVSCSSWRTVGWSTKVHGG